MKSLIRRFIRDEDGQSTTEYILILAVAVMIAMQFKSQFAGTIQKLVGGLNNKADQLNNELMSQ